MASSAACPTGTMRVLRPLPVTVRFARLQVDVVEVEPGEFRQAQAGRIEQLEHRAVARDQCVVRFGARSSSWLQVSGDRMSGKALAALGGRRPTQGLPAKPSRRQAKV
jgi:hypothetical protein